MTLRNEPVDYFISHAGADSVWAEWIDQTLRKSGYTTVTDLYDFKAGHNFILLMDDALERANELLLIWSPQAKQRYMVEQEWSSVMAKHRDRILPVIVEPCEVPNVLYATLRIDLAHETDGNIAGNFLIESLRGRTRPTDPVAFPGKGRLNPLPETPFPPQLQNRVHAQEIEGLRDSHPREGLDRYFHPRPNHPLFSSSLQGVSEVWLAAKGFDSFLHDNAKGISSAVSEGVFFRFLMHDPENDQLMKMMASTSYSNRDYRNVADRLKSAVQQIGRLSESRPDSVSLRLVQWPLTHGATFFGPNDQRGKVYIEIFGYQISLNERRAIMVAQEKDPGLFTYFRDQFLSQWRDAGKVNPT